MNSVLKAKNYIFAGLWSLLAFILLSSSISTSVFYQMPFRQMYIPVYFWLWSGFGIYFLYHKMIGLELKTAIRNMGMVCLIFHLIYLQAEFLANGNIYSTISSVYLYFYIVPFIFLTVLLASSWGLYDIFSKKERALYGVPLAVSPFLCLIYFAAIRFAGGSALAERSFLPIMVYVLVLLIAGLFVYALFRNKAFIDGLIAKISQAVRRFYNDRRSMILYVFVTAFIIRLIFSVILIHRTGADYLNAGDDSRSYHPVAVEVMQDPANAIPVLARQPWPPVYMLLLSVIYMIFGESFYAAVFFQSLFGGALAALIFLIAARIYNHPVSVMAGILTALSQPLIFNASVIGTESIYIPMIALAIWLYLEGMYYSPKYAFIKIALSGCILGLASMTLGSITLFPFAVFLFSVLFMSGKMSRLKQTAAAFLFLASALCVFFIIRNIFYPGVPFGKTKYETAGFDPWSEPTTADYKTIDPDNRRFIALGINPFTDFKGSSVIALKNWKEVLDITWEVYPVKLKGYYFWGNFGFFDPVFLGNPSRLANTYASNLEFYAIVVFLLGFILSFRLKERWPLNFIYTFILYYTFIHGIVFKVRSVRYHCPIKPFLLIILAYGIFLCLKYFFETEDNAGRKIS